MERPVYRSRRCFAPSLTVVRKRALARRVLSLVLVSALAVGCGGQQPKPQDDQGTKAQRTAPVVTGPGRLVSIGGRRSLYLNCVGSGSPTVVLEAGFGDNTDTWSEVQPQLSETTRTCAYDRAGLGNSLPIPGVHDAGDEIDDLERLLDHAHIAPPYVLVGHAYGGLLARLFANAHPDETAGVVLIEAVGRDQNRRLSKIWRAQPAGVQQRVPNPTSEPVVEGVDLRSGQALDTKITTLGDTPLAVITRARDDPGDPLPRSLRRGVDRLWATMQDELASLSSDHLHVIALRSGHYVQRSLNGQPDVVITAVRAVVHAAGTSTQLPPCARLLRGSGVRCRS
jgi:pimeloyl-ACP methyl ester carboxylesterase